MDLWNGAKIPADLHGAVLPYRCEAEDLARLIEARARGWALPQIRSLNFSAKTFEGTVLTAGSLGLLDDEAGDLTESGRSFALAAPESRPGLLREAIDRYEPYALLLEAILGGESPGTTEVGWIERWWATHGYGSSQSNRVEAATVFARFVDYLGLGSYIQGRRGHPSRIEWHGARPGAMRFGPPRASTPPSQPRAASQATPQAEPVAGLPELSQASVAIASEQAPPETGRASRSDTMESAGRASDRAAQETDALSERRQRAISTVASTESDVTVELGPGRMAHLRVPSTLTAAEKARLLALLDLLITTSPGE